MFAKIMVIQWVGGSGPGASPNASELVFYCCHNYHKLSGLKQHKCIISQFCRSEVWMHLASFSALDLMRQNQRVRCPDLLSRGSKFIQVVGRSQFLVVAGLRSLFPFWLSVRSHSQFSNVPCIPGRFASFIFKWALSHLVELYTLNLSGFPLHCTSVLLYPEKVLFQDHIGSLGR